MDEDDERANDWEVDAGGGEVPDEGDDVGAGSELDDGAGEAGEESEGWEPPGDGDEPEALSDLEDVGEEEFEEWDGTGGGADLETIAEFDDVERDSGGRFGGVSTVVTVLSILVVGGVLAGPLLFRLVFGASYGEECREPMDCRSGVCLSYEVKGDFMSKWTTNEGICSSTCLRDEQCPDDSRCFQRQHCAPKPTADIGETCTFPWQCRQGKCVFRKKRTSSGLMGPPPGLSGHEETGTCVSHETLEKQREAREEMLDMNEQLEELRRNRKGGGSGPLSP